MSNFKQKFSAGAVLSGLFLMLIGLCTADSDSNSSKSEYTESNRKNKKDIFDTTYTEKKNYYGDAVEAIGRSDMFGAHMQEAIAYLPKFVSESQYKAVKGITESDMFSVQMCESIKKVFT